MLRRGGDGKLFTWGRRYFSVCLAKSSHKPTPPCNHPHVSADLLLQIELWVPSFQFRGRRENERNSSAFKRNSRTAFPSTSKWKVKRFHPSEARKRIKFGVCWCLRKHRVFSFAACALSVYFSSPNIKGEISSSNILQHFNELLSLTWWQGGNNNPLYLHTTKMSHSQPALLDLAGFEPCWTEMSVIWRS